MTIVISQLKLPPSLLLSDNEKIDESVKDFNEAVQNFNEAWILLKNKLKSHGKDWHKSVGLSACMWTPCHKSLLKPHIYLGIFFLNIWRPDGS